MPLEKVVLVAGPSGVGKTALVERIITGEFHEVKRPTIGFHPYTEKVLLDPIRDRAHLPIETRNILPAGGLELEFWEFGGRERNRQLPRGRQPDGILLCYNVHDRSSFHSVAHLLMHYRMERHLAYERSALVAADKQKTSVGTFLRDEKPPRLVGVLVGCQGDDVGSRSVSEVEATDFAEANSLHYHVVSSAATGEGVKLALYGLAQALMEADEELEVEYAANATALVPEETWALSIVGKDGSTSMTDPRGLRPHEPSRGGSARQDLVEVFTSANERSFSARPLGTCLQLGLLHRAAHVWLCDLGTGALLLRKYSRHNQKNSLRWGCSCHSEVRCYDPDSGAGPKGGPPASESSLAAASRSLSEQLGVKRDVRTQDMWFTCQSNDGTCRELIDVFVVPIEGGALPELHMRSDEIVQWVHFTDIFGSLGASARTLGHFEESYRSTMVQRLQVRLIHSHTAQSTVRSFGGS